MYSWLRSAPRTSASAPPAPRSTTSSTARSCGGWRGGEGVCAPDLDTDDVVDALAVADDVLCQIAADAGERGTEGVARRRRAALRGEQHDHVGGARVGVDGDAVE